ncbi:NAD(P)-binding protein, partial [Ramicandelaber brevisporus]
AQKLDVAGKHVIITGGSSGLGLGVARRMAEAGAHITLIARKPAGLATAQEQVLAARVNPDTQHVLFVSADLANGYDGVSKAIDDAISAMNSAVGKSVKLEALFCCAGAAQPGFLMDQDPSVLEWSMKTNYLSAAYAARAAAIHMTSASKKDGGHIILVSSMAGLYAFTGYTQYSASKYALRGFGEALRSELLPYNIKVTMFYPGNIDTPGFETENQNKPAVTAAIEGKSTPKSPLGCADDLISGMHRGLHSISTEFDGDLLMAATITSSPKGNVVVDWILSGIAYIALLFVRTDHDSTVR